MVGEDDEEEVEYTLQPEERMLEGILDIQMEALAAVVPILFLPKHLETEMVQ